jgi:hypothetical protein
VHGCRCVTRFRWWAGMSLMAARGPTSSFCVT